LPAVLILPGKHDAKFNANVKGGQKTTLWAGDRGTSGDRDRGTSGDRDRGQAGTGDRGQAGTGDRRGQAQRKTPGLRRGLQWAGKVYPFTTLKL